MYVSNVVVVGLAVGFKAYLKGVGIASRRLGNSLFVEGADVESRYPWVELRFLLSASTATYTVEVCGVDADGQSRGRREVRIEDFDSLDDAWGKIEGGK